MKTTTTQGVRRRAGIARLSILAIAVATITTQLACEAETEDPYSDIIDTETAACLEQSEADRSEACKEKVAKRTKLQQLKRFHHVMGIVCVRDVKTHCSEMGTFADRDSVANCLDTHQEDLMPRCRNKVRIKAHVRIGRLFDLACSEDMDKYCGHVSRNAEPQDFKTCMREHIDDIAPVCKDVLDGKILTKREQERQDRIERRKRRKAAAAAVAEEPAAEDPGVAE